MAARLYISTPLGLGRSMAGTCKAQVHTCLTHSGNFQLRAGSGRQWHVRKMTSRCPGPRSPKLRTQHLQYPQVPQRTSKITCQSLAMGSQASAAALAQTCTQQSSPSQSTDRRWGSLELSCKIGARNDSCTSAHPVSKSVPCITGILASKALHHPSP